MATGRITDAYSGALRSQQLRAFMRDDASLQPGALQELLLHETAVAWTRLLLTQTTPAEPWLEGIEDYGRRLRGIAHSINSTYDVEGLCKEFPERVQEMLDREGDRLRK